MYVVAKMVCFSRNCSNILRETLYKKACAANLYDSLHRLFVCSYNLFITLRTDLYRSNMAKKLPIQCKKS